jgi:hypothetical protein
VSLSDTEKPLVTLPSPVLPTLGPLPICERR